MSFTSIVKNEITHLETTKPENISELSAIIRNDAIINETNIKITTENSSVARRIFELMKQLYDVNSKVTVRRGYNYNKHYLYILEITHKTKDILSDLSIYDHNTYYNIPRDYLIEDEDLLRAYIRGLFLSTGSINDPKKSRYHLEFIVDNEKYAEFICTLLNKYLLKAKYLKRENKYMVYIKEAEKIGDFLRIINASSAVLYYEDIRIYRDHKNMTNRLNNCEQANVDKIIATAAEQVRQIEVIKEYSDLELLDEKVKEAAYYRLKYPETSLQELSEIISIETGKDITKSGLHHRFQKIKLLAQKLENNK